MDPAGQGSGSERATRELEERIRLLEDENRELSAGESRLRAIFENEPECVKLLALDGTLLEMNPAGLRMIEADSLDQVRGRSIYPLVAAEHRDAFRDVLDSVMRGEHCTLEFESIGLRGGRRWLETHASPLRDASGDVSALLGITRDITDRRRAAQARRETEARLLEVFRSCPVGVAIHRWSDRTCVDVNSTFTALLGWSREEVIGRTAAEVGMVSGPAAAELHAQIGQRRSVQGSELAVTTRDGSVRHILLGAQIVDLDSGTHVITTFVDITERKRAEESMRESEARFRELAETIRDVFWITDVENERLLYVSPAYESVYGRPCASLHADPRSWLDAVHPEDRDRIRSVAAARRSHGFDHEYRLLRSDGDVRWIRDRAFPVRGADGAIERIVGLASDVTDRKAAEMQMHQAQKMESIGRLAAGIAHDFNNILTVINGVAELAGSELGDGPLRDDIAAIRQAAMRATGLTRQLLAFSRQQVLKPEVLRLNAVVEEVEGLLCRVLGEDIRVEVRLDPDVRSVLADPGQIHQVILNLAINSRDAMPQGGVLSIETRSVIVSEAGARRHPGLSPGRYSVLVLTDTGAGMDAATRQRLFEPFFTTKAPGKGTGLGLATVHGIVKQSGGEIEVESEAGSGTTFTIYLPESESAAEHHGDAPVASAAHGAECLLIVDDDAGVRAMTRRVLERQGYHVIQADDGAEALALMEQCGDTVDLLLTDVVMPGMSGIDLARRLREARPSLRVLFISGYSEDAVDRHGVLGESMKFLAKPYSVSGLLQEVREALDSAAAEAE